METKSVADLLADLKSSEKRVRKDAANALAKVSGEEAKVEFDAILSALKEDNDDVRSWVCALLGTIGPDAHEATNDLINFALRRKSRDVRVIAATALGKIGNPEAVPALINALKDKREKVRNSAAKSLGRFSAQAEKIIPQLSEALKELDESIRHSAIKSLGRLNHKNAIEPLLESFKDAEDRIEAAKALGKLSPSPETVEGLLKALKYTNLDVREIVLDSIGKMGPHAKIAVPVLMEELRDLRGNLCLKASQALGNIGNDAEEAVPMLTYILKDKNLKDIRPIIAEALTKITGKKYK